MKHHEDNLQMACVTWFRLQYPDVLMIHPRNGGSLKSASEGAKFKRMGVVAGVADLQVIKSCYTSYGPFDGVLYHGFFIELKAGKAGRQSPAQKAFQEKVESEGYKYAICRDIDEFMNEVNKYLQP